MPLLDTTKNLLLGAQQVDRAYLGPDLVWQRFTIIGGTEATVTVDGTTYKVHRFTGTSSLEVIGEGEVDILLLSGGGGGGRADNRSGTDTPGPAGGGGGAGGYRILSDIAVTSGTYTVTVGAGGAQHTNGVNSSVFSQTSQGGGHGGRGDVNSVPAQSGGSGGGASSRSPGAGAGTSGQGNAGGVHSGNNGGSGGGAGGAGLTGTSTRAAGGNPVTVNFDGISRTLAGGGVGGQSVFNQFPASISGAANTGYGGSGGSSHGFPTQQPTQDGGAGGSGLVIVRYRL